MPTANNYNVDKALTNVSLGYQNNDKSFISDEVFPRLKVKTKSGIFYEFDKANLRSDVDERAPGTEANEVEYDLKQNTYGPLIDHALKVKVTDEEVEQADEALEPFIDGTEFLTEKMRINKEVDAAAKLNALPADVTLASLQQFNDYNNSDPVSVIQAGVDTMKSRTFRTPNTLITNYEVLSKIMQHPDLQAKLPSTDLKLLDWTILARIFGVQRFLIGDAQLNTAKKGQADTTAYIWGKAIYLAYLEPNPGKRKMSATYGLELTDGLEVSRYREQAIRSTWIEMRRFYEHKITNTNAIYKIAAAVA